MSQDEETLHRTVGELQAQIEALRAEVARSAERLHDGLTRLREQLRGLEGSIPAPSPVASAPLRQTQTGPTKGTQLGYKDPRLRGPVAALIVDDDELMRSMVRDILEEKGYRVFTAADGVSAIDIAKREQLDVILLDIVMPGMDGYETCRRLKEDPTTREVPILMMTAVEDEKLNQKAFAVGAAFTMAKTTNVEKILNTLSLALGGRKRPM